MLAPKGALDPVKDALRIERIPLIELPLDAPTLARPIDELDAVLLTHLHRDHWDSVAQALIPKTKPIFCQPADVERLQQQGFHSVRSFDGIHWHGVQLERVGGQHGRGELALKMGPVSGVMLTYESQRLYIAGDTVWCPEVADAIAHYRPALVAVNAGAAQFVYGEPITMTAEEVLLSCQRTAPGRVMAVHMDAVNHCRLSRQQLALIVEEAKLTYQCLVAGDGETVYLS